MKLKHATDEIDHSQSPPLELQRAQEERLKRAWELPKGWRYWSAVNNEVVGVWYTAAAFCFLIFGGALAMLIRVQLAVPNNSFLSANAYNQVFTTHGTVMMFLFAIPIFEAFSIMLLPQMLGARSALSAFVGLWLLGLRHWRHIFLRRDFFQCRARWRLVYVSAAGNQISVGQRHRHLAVGSFVY